jgi:branched-chain amino acid transport system substrate-binding protein
MKRILLSLGVSLALVITLACRKDQSVSAPDTGNIRVGVYADLSGQGSAAGASTRNGIDLAKDEINQAGGINGRQLECLFEDDKGLPDPAAAAADKLISQVKVHALIGGSTPQANLAAAAKAQSGHVPLITLSSGDAKVTQQGDFIFGIAPLMSAQGKQMGTYAANNLKAKTAAILSEEGSEYGTGLAQSFADEFGRLSGQVLVRQTFSTGAGNLNLQLAGIHAANPDVIYIPVRLNAVATIAKEAKQLGIKAVLLGADGWNDPAVLAAGGSAFDGAYITSHYSADDPVQTARAFSSSYQKRFGKSPDQTAALAYDAIKLITDALKRAGSAEATKLRDALAHTSKFPGLTGSISIDADRNASKPTIIFKLQDGKIYPVYKEEQ